MKKNKTKERQAVKIDKLMQFNCIDVLEVYESKGEFHDAKVKLVNPLQVSTIDATSQKGVLLFKMTNNEEFYAKI